MLRRQFWEQSTHSYSVTRSNSKGERQSDCHFIPVNAKRMQKCFDVEGIERHIDTHTHTLAHITITLITKAINVSGAEGEGERERNAISHNANIFHVARKNVKKGI